MQTGREDQEDESLCERGAAPTSSPGRAEDAALAVRLEDDCAHPIPCHALTCSASKLSKATARACAASAERDREAAASASSAAAASLPPLLLLRLAATLVDRRCLVVLF